MANYGISKVRYDSDDQFITHVLVHVFAENELSPEHESARRQDVVKQIEAGDEFVTVLNVEKYEFSARMKTRFTMGSKVEIIPVNGTDFIRTDGNSTEKDNLELLPRF